MAKLRANTMRPFLFVLALSLPVLGSSGSEPTNLDVDKAVVQRYYNSGRYQKDVREVIARAKRGLLAGISKPGKKAIVFDIDDTMLSSYSVTRSMGFGFVPALWTEWEWTAAAPAIEPVRELYDLAKKKGVTIFLITGRTSDVRQPTEANLARRGFTGYSAIIFKPADYRKASIIPFKSSARRAIVAQGFRVLMSVGDQWSDLKGGCAERPIKIPNPMYMIP
ncbi:MAG TPA: HAD family acid phosphatase [Fimbriimonadaceae bacterium]|nr:HAD family acid phosphatase [Fimbriimonadaceae bacterium]